MREHPDDRPAAPPPEDTIPAVAGDQTVPLLREGYPYVSRRLDDLGASAFQGRLFGRKVVFMRGRQAAQQFYDNTKFVRAGAVPRAVRLTLFGKGTVQALDDEPHRWRKAMFNSLTGPRQAAELADIADLQWEAAIRRWSVPGRVRLFNESIQVFGSAACHWAGIPTQQPTLAPRLSDMAATVDEFGAIGGGRVRGRLARNRVNRWARIYIDAVRSGRLAPHEGTALAVVANHRDADGRLLPARTAADELLNILRPTVAVSWFVAYAAHALHRHPDWQYRLAWGDDAELAAFADEVRRYYPLAPALGARARREFEWLGHRFPAGRWVILDLYGTNHDPRLWSEPDRFDPQRFTDAEPDRFTFVPQGGGHADIGHRCPGEDFTTVLLQRAVRHLARLSYEVPKQDMTIVMNRFPARIRSGFVISNAAPVLTEPSPSRNDSPLRDR